MNQKAFWVVFCVIQGTAAVLALTLDGSAAAHLPTAVIAVAFPLTVVFLFPGLFVSSLLLDKLRLPSTDTHIIAVAIVLNAVIWYGVAVAIFRFRSRTARTR